MQEDDGGCGVPNGRYSDRVVLEANLQQRAAELEIGWILA